MNISCFVVVTNYQRKKKKKRKKVKIEKMKYKPKAEFPIEEAKKLWSKGWCWQRLGNKYGYSKVTIRKWVRKNTSIQEYAEARKKHKKTTTHFVNYATETPLELKRNEEII